MNETQLTDEQLDRAPSKAELDHEDEIRRRQQANRPNGEFSPGNQDPWAQAD